MPAPQGEKLIADNRRARHDYHLLEKLEAGLQLTGTEVKSLRDGRVVPLRLVRRHPRRRGVAARRPISIYDKGGYANHEPERARKLLLHRKEIDSLYGLVREKGLTLVPTRIYFKNGRVKVEIADRPRQGSARQAPRRRRARHEAPDRARAQVAPYRPAGIGRAGCRPNTAQDRHVRPARAATATVAIGRLLGLEPPRLRPTPNRR